MLHPKSNNHRHRSVRERGAAAVLAMMFLVIFGSLATAMAIVSQGNLRTADSHLKINRSLAAAETGMNFLVHRLEKVTPQVKTRSGAIDDTEATDLWIETAQGLVDELISDSHFVSGSPYFDTATNTLYVPLTNVGPEGPSFRAEFTPHPLAGEDYDAAFYDRPPYDGSMPETGIDNPVSNANPLDARWIRVKVTASDGAAGSQVFRSVAMDFQITKKIKFAILSKSRVMIGRNVMIQGRVGSRFLETSLTNGHPIQVESDFRGMTSNLDANLDALIDWLEVNDINGDNRLNVHSATETDGITDPQTIDFNGDGYIDDYDFFLDEFDANGDDAVSLAELETHLSPVEAAQLLELIDTFGDDGRIGYDDGFVNNDDRYAKVRGEVVLKAAMQDWNDGAANGRYQDFLQGPIHPDFGEAPLTFESPAADEHAYEASDFDTSQFETNADGGTLIDQATAQDGVDGASMDLSGSHVEEVPFGAAYPYDYYSRPVFQNMTFENVFIPRGTNALFINCTFKGVTYIDSETDNSDPDWNYSGMWADDTGTIKHADRQNVIINGVEEDFSGYADPSAGTKNISNNIRFDNCTFDGAIVTAVPDQFTHVRNKISFTGATQFKDLSKTAVEDPDNGSELSQEERTLYRRSTMLSPNYSVEMGTFVAPHDSNERVNLSGTIVAGVLDMRGNVRIDGTILTTFEPVSNEGPVIGETSPQFNTTLGYFPSSAGDLEAELPVNGLGTIQVRYDPTIPPPDGILGPISVEPIMATYFEGGQ